MNLLFLITILVSILVLSNGLDSQRACAALAKCMADAVNQRRYCDNITEIIHQEWPPKYTEPQKRCQEHGTEVTKGDYVRRDHKIACLEATLANTTSVSCNVTRIAECESIANNYKPRSTDQLVQASSTLAEEKQKKEDAAKAAAAAAKQAAAAAKEAAAASTAADKALRDYLNKQSSECSATASQIDSQCSIIAGCCSESWICDLEYQRSDQFRDYATKQHSYQLEHRVVYPPSCPSPATTHTPTSGPTTGSPVATETLTSTLAPPPTASGA